MNNTITHSEFRNAVLERLQSEIDEAALEMQINVNQMFREHQPDCRLQIMYVALKLARKTNLLVTDALTEIQDDLFDRLPEEKIL